ncbi:flavodoxin domain-containing protein, partial [Saccharicrinis fermentans]
MEKTAVLVGSSTGNTESVGEKIVEKLGNGAKLINVADASVAQIEDCKNLILGTSTWGVGDLQDDWEDFLPKLAQADLNGKTVALFGLGDAESYYDSFVDGIGTIYEEIKDKG